MACANNDSECTTTFYPQAESSQTLSLFTQQDKRKERALTPPHTLHSSPTPSPAGPHLDPPGGNGDGLGGLPPPLPPRPICLGIAAPALITPIPNGKERGIEPEPFTDIKKFQ